MATSQLPQTGAVWAVRRAEAWLPLRCQTDVVRAGRRTEARPPVNCQTNEVTAERRTEARPPVGCLRLPDRCGHGREAG